MKKRSEAANSAAASANLLQLRADLRFVYQRFPLSALLHLLANFHRLRRRHYAGPGNTGCLFKILSETLPEDERITSKESLIRHVTRRRGQIECDLPEYAPAKWLVRSFDGDIVPHRYGEDILDFATIRDVLESEVRNRLAEDARPDAPPTGTARKSRAPAKTARRGRHGDRIRRLIAVAACFAPMLQTTLVATVSPITEK